MGKRYLLVIVLVALIITGCTQQEGKREEEVKELVTSFIEAYNNGSVEKLYFMLSDDLRGDYSVEDAQELVYQFGSGFTLNITEYRMRGKH